MLSKLACVFFSSASQVFFSRRTGELKKNTVNPISVTIGTLYACVRACVWMWCMRASVNVSDGQGVCVCR